MTLHQKIGLSIFTCIALVLLAGGYFAFQYLGVSADEFENHGEIKGQVTLSDDFNSDGKKENVVITSYQKDGKYLAFIASKNHFLRYRERPLTGFEEDIAFCPVSSVSYGSEKVICIFGEVGAHAQNIQIIRWSDFSPIIFTGKEGTTSQNLLSDVPNFDFGYPAADKSKIYVDNRNYDKDPLVDIIRTYYYLGNNAFGYNGEDEISNEGLIK